MNDLKRIIFLGSPEFAIPSLTKLIESEQFKPLAVITQPDRPSGRSKCPQPTPVKVMALEHKIPVYQPEDINSDDFLNILQSLRPDLLVTVAYGQKLKKAMRNSAVFGAVNLHPSLLPELRGAAPIPFTLWQGSIQTGITIFKLVSRMDAGPIYFSKPLFIFPDENATFLTDRLARIGAQFLLQFLTDFFDNPWEPIPQDEGKATYCRKLDKEDGIIDWNQPAKEIQNHIRALSVSPGAYTFFRGLQLKILAAEIRERNSSLPPGSIVSVLKNMGFIVQTADKELLIMHVQPSGKKEMSAWAFHLGAKLETGERLEQNA